MIKEGNKTKTQSPERLAELQKRIDDLEKSGSSILSAIPHAVLGLKERRIVFANNAVEKVFGWKPDDLIGQSTRIFYRSDEEYEEIGRHFYSILEKRQSYSEKFPCRRKDGKDILCAVSASRISDGLTERKIVAVYEDITEYIQAEKAIKESEEKYRNIFENAIEGIFQTTPEGRYLTANPALAKIYGYDTPEELIRDITDIGRQGYVDPEERELFKGIMERHGAVAGFEYRRYRKDGSTVWVSMNAHAVRDGGGKILYYEGTVENIDKRKQAEARLRESEERYRMAIEHSNDGVTIVKGDAHLYVNNRFVEIFGYDSPEDIIGRPLSIVVHPDDLSVVKETTQKRQQGIKTPERYEFKGLTKNKETIFLEASATHTVYQGEPVALVYLRDVTGRKNVEAEKSNLEAQLLQAQKMEAIGQLAGGVAHDFNNILTTIIGYGNIIQMRMEKDNPMRVYVDQILSSSQRAAQLTHSLLAFSRKQVIELRPHRINTIIRGVERLLARLLTEDIELNIVLPELDLTVLADVTQMEQVLINLATNARDAMPHGGALTVAVEKAEINNAFIKRHGYGEIGHYARISVSDTGVGMDEKTKKKIFDPFFTTKEVGKGTGLGLSIVYGIIKQHNGYINVASEPGKGTAFHIYFPIVNAKVKKPKQPFLFTQGGNETLLLAEDNAEVRTLIKNVLEQVGYTVVEAKDGEEAVTRFNEHKDAVSLLIADVVMPKRNGKDVYTKLRKMKPIKVIFISGYTADVVLDKGVYGKTLNYITKPVSPNELLKKVREVLDG